MRHKFYEMDLRDLNFKYCKIEQYGNVIYFKIDEKEVYYYHGDWIVEYRGETIKVCEDRYIFDMSDRIKFTNQDNIEEITEEEFKKNKERIINLILNQNEV
jgi:hypothetical protein